MGETRRNKYGIGENVKMTDVKGQRAQEIDSLWGLQERAREMQMLQYKHSVGCDPNTICHGWAMKNPFQYEQSCCWVTACTGSRSCFSSRTFPVPFILRHFYHYCLQSQFYVRKVHPSKRCGCGFFFLLLFWFMSCCTSAETDKGRLESSDCI